MRATLVLTVVLLLSATTLRAEDVPSHCQRVVRASVRGFVDLPPCRAVGATLCTPGGRHNPNHDFGGSPVKSGETVCIASRSDAQVVHPLCKNLCVHEGCAGQARARGWDAAYTSRSVSTVTSV